MAGSLKLTKPKVVKHKRKKSAASRISVPRGRGRGGGSDIGQEKEREKEKKEISSEMVKRLFELKDLGRVLGHLSKKDAVLGEMISTLGPPKSLVSSASQHDAFTSLVKSIVGQQLSGKAAASIYKRVEEACGCYKGEGKVDGGGSNCSNNSKITPEKILGFQTEELRALGLSGRKCEYLGDLARHFDSGQLSDVKLKSMTDEEVMEALINVRGLGEWSVHMFQMFHLGSPDVLPHGDLAVKKGAYALYIAAEKNGKNSASYRTTSSSSKSAVASKAELEEIAMQWAPFRSIGSWYMWRYKEFLERKTNNNL